MKPILFNTDMVRAILAGRKMVTRRVAFPNRDLREFPRPDNPDAWWFRGRAYRNWGFAMYSVQGVMELCRFRPGDILYVRETWAEMPYGYVYRADTEEPEGWDADDRWHPSIHMPKEAARLFLRVTNVRVERLQSIKTDECVDEGAVMKPHYTKRGDLCLHSRYKTEFSTLWDSTVKKSDIDRFGWEANPWVWVISFERCDKPEE